MASICCVFDWDDTLYPSYKKTVSQHEHETIDNIISELLSITTTLGDVVIITNGTTDWVGKCLMYLEKSWKIICEK